MGLPASGRTTAGIEPAAAKPAHDTMDRQPLFANRFSVLIDEVEVGISEVSPLSSDTEEPEESAPGGRGGPRYRSVVLRRAVTGSSELFRWRELAHAGKPAERTVRIRHYDPSGEHPINDWELEGAWPRRWSGPALDAADDKTIACEELELAYARLVWHDRTDSDREER